MSAKGLPQEAWKAASGKVLSSLLKQEGMTQKALAAAIGKEPSTVSNQVSGRVFPQKRSREAIARHFELTLEELDAMIAQEAKALDRSPVDADELQFRQELQGIEDERTRVDLDKAWNELKAAYESRLALTAKEYAYEKRKLMLAVLRNSKK